jgi:hypothetical protein
MYLNPRLIAMFVVLLTVFFGLFYLYFRARVTEDAGRTWEETRPPLPKDTFAKVERARRMPRIRRWLVVWVYGVPLSVLGVGVYILNLPVEG